MSDTSNQNAGQTGTDDNHETDETHEEQRADTGRAGSEDNLKADLAKERKDRQAAQRDLKVMQKRLEALETASKTESERAIDQARVEGKTDALKVANARVVKMAIRLAATDRLADPSDADVIDASQFEVDDDGNVDNKAIEAEIARLLKEKPHWAKADRRSNGSVDQGARGAGAKPTDMNSLIRKAAGR